MGPPLDRDHSARHRETMGAIAGRELETWPRGEPFPAVPRVSRIVLRVITSVVFGGAGKERETALRERFKALFEAGANPLRVVWSQQNALRGRKPPRWLTKLLTPIDALLFEEIGHVRRSPDDGRDDLLATLARARKDGGAELTDRQLRDQIGR
jgi:cytochrome P450